MSNFSDYRSEMPRRRPIDDDTVERLVAGDTRDEDLAGLVSFVDDVRASAWGLPPEPTPELAAVLARGFSTEKGDQPAPCLNGNTATAASNVHGPAPKAQVAGLPKWRSTTMKLSRTLAGLPLIAKVALGVTVAAAATTGAGAAGVLPGPVEHAVSSITTFGPGDGGSNDATPPTNNELPPSTTLKPAGGDTGSNPGGTPIGGSTGGSTEPKHEPAPPVTTTPPATEPQHSTEPTSPPPTSPPGDTVVPELSTLACHGEGAQGARRVDCTWTPGPAGTAKYVVLRTGDGQNRVVYQSDNLSVTSCSDATVAHGTTYQYMVLWLAADGTTQAHSNHITVTP